MSETILTPRLEVGRNHVKAWIGPIANKDEEGPGNCIDFTVLALNHGAYRVGAHKTRISHMGGGFTCSTMKSGDSYKSERFVEGTRRNQKVVARTIANIAKQLEARQGIYWEWFEELCEEDLGEVVAH